MTWQLCGIAVGAVAWSAGLRGDGTGTAGETRAERWDAARSTVEAASQALASADGAALDAVLAPEVHVSGQWLARPDALRELVAWRSSWVSVDVLVLEVLVSGVLCAATGYVIGIGAGARPSCVAIHLMSRDG